MCLESKAIRGLPSLLSSIHSKNGVIPMQTVAHTVRDQGLVLMGNCHHCVLGGCDYAPSVFAVLNLGMKTGELTVFILPNHLPAAPCMMNTDLPDGKVQHNVGKCPDHRESKHFGFASLVITLCRDP